ncbi:hypothetical protein BDAP_000552 [Binucleata daphniae]
MKNNGVLYLDDFLSNNKENRSSDESNECDANKHLYEIEEYILRKQAIEGSVCPQMLYKEEHFPSTNDLMQKKPFDKKQSKKIKQREGYKPKYVRGKGVLREGLCEMCNLWFRLKTSSYWYHMNFKHGIASNGTTYPEPNIVYRGEKAFSVCKICKKEVNLGVSKKTMTYNWYKHFQKEHTRLYE